MSNLRAQLISLSKWGRNSDDSLGKLQIRQEQLLDEFPGPAFILGANLDVIHLNALAEPLIKSLNLQPESSFSEALKKGFEAGGPSLQTAAFVGHEDKTEIFDLTFLPLEEVRGTVLVTAKNVTLQRNLTNALIASRQLFKDLVTCTAEFVWETDDKGQFRYVSPRGAIGYSAAELDGQLAQALILGDGTDNNELPVNPFDSKVPVSDQIVWLRDKSMALACMKIRSIPVFDDAGNWTGCRGAGRDITDEMARKNQMERLAAQEEMLTTIVDAMRREVDPEKLFQMAGEGACEAMNSTRLWIGRKGPAGILEAAFNRGLDEELENRLFKWFSDQQPKDDEDYRLIKIATEQWRIFISPIFSKNKIDGMIALVRRKEAVDVSDGEARLLHLLSDHLGVALIQIKAREMLVELSRTDELSRLLNRRAFHEDVIKRIAHGKRTKAPNALFYIDLDNFKPVNDRFGHEKGDEVLKGVSQLLKENSRVGDLVSRLGGDEFAMWLENIPREEAVEKAESLQIKCKALSQTLGVTDPSLSFSIGITCTAGDDAENIEGLLAQADSAMYLVKARGKGSYAIAGDTTEPSDKTSKD